MFHYFNSLTNTKGDSLVGYFCRAIDTTTGSVVSIYADNNSTPIITTSGIANMCKTDTAGNFDFYIAPGTYHLDIYAPDGATFFRRISNVAMESAKGDSAYDIAVAGGFVGNEAAWLASLNGTDGTSATVAVGTVTTGTAGGTATVSTSGTSSAVVLDITIPRGAPGVPGGEAVGSQAWSLADGSGYNWFLASPTELRHKVVQANTRDAKLALLGDPDPTVADMRNIAERIGIHGTGESLSVGNTGLPLLSTSPSAYAEMFSGGVAVDSAADITSASDPNLVNHRTSIIPSFEQAHTGASFVAGYETQMSAISKMIVQLLADENGIDISTSGMKFLLTTDGRNGSSITAEMDNAGTWTAERFSASLSQAAAVYGAAGKSYLPGVMTLTIGTNDCINNVARGFFYNLAVTLLAQRQARMEAVTPGNRRLPIIFGQTGTHVQTAATIPNVALDQVDLAVNHQEFILACIQYAIEYPTATGYHPNSYGYNHMGAYYGWAIKRLLWDGFRVTPLLPKFSAQGSKIIATFPVNPGHKIVMATPPSGSVLSNWGVTATTAGGTAKALSNPRIVGTNTVVWDAPSVPADTWKFQCGYTGNANIGFTNLAEQRRDGPLIYDPDRLALPMYRWLPIYEGTLS